MKIASWNVNSLRVRLPHLLEWLGTARPAVLGLQETKLTDDKFPQKEIEAAGYHVAFAGQPTYNGVALLADASRFQPPYNVQINNPLFPDEQARLIAADLQLVQGPEALRCICGYIPNGSEVGSEKFDYKLRWLTACAAWIKQELVTHPRLAFVGDFNIAPDDQDVHDPNLWHEKILCSTAERQHLKELFRLGLQDAYRLHEQPADQYSWWDYREAAFRRNRGLRIDLILLSAELAAACTASGIDRGPRTLEKPSDHAPVWADIRLN
ncbi:MAG: exodeoxyribonuclease III [Betaproteobacteria bacterium]|nr:exodeoxyribonuclease III [Betaproteobacteria bacterium]